MQGIVFNRQVSLTVWNWKPALLVHHIITITGYFFHSLTHCIPFIFSEKVAIKILDKTKLDSKTQRLLSREISSMERLHHPNIIRLYEVVETLAKLHMVMEYAGGGELFTKISNEGKLPEAEAKPLYAQVTAALQHMVRFFLNFSQYSYTYM